MGRYRVLTLTQPLSRGVLQHTARAVTGLVLAGLVVAAAPVAAQDTSSQRNMVFILTDDQRFDGLGLLNEYFETPNLDTLAEGGVVFENAFVTTSLCSPSRASILSGLYAHTHQVLDNSTPMPPDIGERHDLAAAQPEVLTRLQSAYARWDSEMMDPRWIRQDRRNAEVGGRLKTDNRPD